MRSLGRRMETVLVVDDDVVYLRSCKRGFGDRDVVTSECLDDARDALGRRSFDLAIVDLRIGTASGIDLLRDIKRDHPSTAVVLVSGYMSVAFAVLALRIGADAVLCKPVACLEILREVEGCSGHAGRAADETPTLARAEWEHITRVLVDCDGNVSMAARRLGIYRQSLQRKLRKLPPGV